MSFSERLEQLLREKGFTAKQLTQDLRIGNTSVTDWKRGKSTPSPNTLIGISQILGVSVDYLLGVEKPAVPEGEVQDSASTDRIIAAQSGGKATKVEETIKKNDDAKRELAKDILSMKLTAHDVDQIKKIIKTFEE